MRLHHVQVAMPPGAEALARRFYADGLGLTEVDKPVELAGRGGAWFRAYDARGPGGPGGPGGPKGTVTAEIHVGVEDRFVPARKAHPALVVDSVVELDELALHLRSLGFEVDESQRTTFEGYLRFHTFDGHRNRVEILTPVL